MNITGGQIIVPMTRCRDVLFQLNNYKAMRLIFCIDDLLTKVTELPVMVSRDTAWYVIISSFIALTSPDFVFWPTALVSCQECFTYAGCNKRVWYRRKMMRLRAQIAEADISIFSKTATHHAKVAYGRQTYFKNENGRFSGFDFRNVYWYKIFLMYESRIAWQYS